MTETISRANVATHNGVLTIRSRKTGEHRTFRIKTQTPDARFAPGERIVSLLVGPDNTTDYQGFAFIDADHSGRARVSVWRSKRGGQFERLARMLEALDEHVESGRVTVHFESCCRRCNRALTDPVSIERPGSAGAKRKRGIHERRERALG